MATWRDRLSGFMQTKSSAVQQMIVDLTGPNKPIYTPRNFEQLAREGFQTNVYVYRAILTIGQAAAAVPWKLFREGKKLVEVDQHPLIDIMRRPNPSEGGAAFWKKVFAYLYLSGNSYIETVGADGGLPVELWALRPDRIRIIPDPRTFVSGYQYTVSGNSQVLPAEQVLHWKMFNPIDDFYGLSPIVVASHVIDSMNAAHDWNTALLQNYARPPGALVVSGRLDPNQREQLKKDMTQKYSGRVNAGRPLLLESGMTWLDMATAPADMDWLAGIVQNAREIAIAIGVPPELLGDSANKTYSNVQEARKALYSEIVIPHLIELRDALNTWLVPQFDAGLRLDIDTSSIEALQEDQTAKRTFLMSAYAGSVLMLNEVRKEMGFEELADGDVFMVPTTVTLTPESELLPDVDDDQGPLPAYVIQAPAPLPGTAVLDAGNRAMDDDTNVALKSRYRVWLPRTLSHKAARTKPMRKVHWQVIDAQRERWTPEVAKHVKALFENQHATVLYAVKNATSKDQIIKKALAAAKSYDTDLLELVTAIYLHVGQPFAKQTRTALLSEHKRRTKRARKDTSDGGYYDASDTIQAWLNTNAGKKVKGISQTTLDDLQTALAEGVDLGESIPELAARVDNLYLDQIYANRSETIARTEVIGASNFGSYAGAQSTGLDLVHSWLSTGGPRTRETHAEADGQTVPLDQPYDVGSSQLMYPGDGSMGADAGEIVNCRCTEVYDLADTAS